MQSLGLLLLSSLALATAQSLTFTPTPLDSCILSGDPCSTGSICTPTSICGGQCYTPVTLPPAIPCTVGNDAPCPTNGFCTPTMYPPTTGPYGGQCITIDPPPPPPTTTPIPGPPTTPCNIGGGQCPGGSFCSQTEVCNGLCLGTAIPPPQPTPPPTPTPTPCGGWRGKKCPKKQKCVKPGGGACGYGQDCQGVCVPK